MMSRVEISEPSPDIAVLLGRSADAGIVLDYVHVKQVVPAATSEVHQQALHLAVCHSSAHRSLPPPSEPLTIDAGHPISVDEFFGPAFDREGARLLMPAGRDVQRSIRARGWPDNVIAGPYTWTDQDDPDHPVWFFDHSAPVGGYAVLFTQPPHMLQVPHSEVQSLFLAINQNVLGSPSETSEIWEWSVDSGWAQYFEDGEEWWGIAAWTLRVTEDRLVVVLASATD